jgi:hypothetical protein
LENWRRIRGWATVGRERRMPVVPAHAQGNSFPSSSWPELLLLPSILRISSVHWGSLRHWLLGRIKKFLGGLLFLIFWDLEVAWLAPELPKFLCQSLIFFSQILLDCVHGKNQRHFPRQGFNFCAHLSVISPQIS